MRFGVVNLHTPLFSQSSRYYVLDHKIELGEMAGLFFNDIGRILFYLCIEIYLYGGKETHTEKYNNSILMVGDSKSRIASRVYIVYNEWASANECIYNIYAWSNSRHWIAYQYNILSSMCDYFIHWTHSVYKLEVIHKQIAFVENMLQ